MIPRAVRDWVCVLGALALAVGVAGCGGPGVGVASPSPTPTFLAQETMCEVVPSRILVEEMSFRTTDYAFEHHTSNRRERREHRHLHLQPQRPTEFTAHHLQDPHRLLARRHTQRLLPLPLQRPGQRTTQQRPATDLLRRR